MTPHGNRNESEDREARKMFSVCEFILIEKHALEGTVELLNLMKSN